MMFRALSAPSGLAIRTGDRLLIVVPVVLAIAWALLSAWCISILCRLGPLAVAPTTRGGSGRGADIVLLSPSETNTGAEVCLRALVKTIAGTARAQCSPLPRGNRSW